MEFRDQQPIYLQIADFVCKKIITKQWASGDRVPSVRELAIELEVNPNTVMRTYEFLQQKEIIYNKRGVGLFVSDEATKNANNYRRGEFIQKEVPAFFASMSLLQINIEELDSIFKKYKKLKI